MDHKYTYHLRKVARGLLEAGLDFGEGLVQELVGLKVPLESLFEILENGGEKVFRYLKEPRERLQTDQPHASHSQTLEHSRSEVTHNSDFPSWKLSNEELDRRLKQLMQSLGETEQVKNQTQLDKRNVEPPKPRSIWKP